MAGPVAGIRLPAGLWRDGERHRIALVRAPEPAAELPRAGGTPAERATQLVARSVERIGALAPVGVDQARELVAGRRRGASPPPPRGAVGGGGARLARRPAGRGGPAGGA